ncbi:MAG: pgk [Gammaproteobacteria bacterium]|nr:pgk [Gammaproteobacteria bacterium]
MNSERLKSIDDLEVKNKKVLVRVDFNVPVKNGKVTDDTRIRASLPTIQQLLAAGAQVLLMTHLGRPEEGVYEEKYSLAPVAARLAEMLREDVPLVRSWRRDKTALPSGRIVMLENVRFEIGETDNADDLARHLASLCDIYVNDAFATAHRAQASTHGVAKFAPQSCAGPLIIQEITALTRVLASPKRPLVAVVGGSKVSTKLTILESLLTVVDQLIVGGGIANTFLAAAGYAIGQSLHEPDLVDVARQLMDKARTQGKAIPLPTDVVCGKTFTETAVATIKPIAAIAADDMVMDVGPDTARAYAQLLTKAKTIVWNGPLGVFEFESFSQGTRIMAEAIANSGAFSIAGGGDTLAAISKFGIGAKLSYISTAGGAFLEFLEGRELPAISILKLKNT